MIWPCVANYPTVIPTPAIHNTLQRLQAEAAVANHRLMVLFSGEQQWCHDEAHRLYSTAAGWLWIGKQQQHPNYLQTLLGGESAGVVFDAFSGFDPNSFGAAVGTVRGGGLVAILAPPLAEWDHYPDPTQARITVYPILPEQVSCRYLQRLRTLLQQCPSTLLIQQHMALPPRRPPVPQTTVSPASAPSTQQQAVAAVVALAHGHPHCPLLLSADRGRGKSAALGIAAAQLLQHGQLHIVATAPTPASLTTLFRHAASTLSQTLNPHHPVTGLHHQQGSLHYLAPDHLCHEACHVDLLLVDEAAALPSALLQQLLLRYPRIVFSTTLHGYEGSGQGFNIRFRHLLDRDYPGWQTIQLLQPMRWAADDPVEQSTHRLLMLDTDPLAPPSAPPPHQCRLVQLDRDALVHDEPRLRQLFGLLIAAHYRTTPLDLRQLLDGPNITLFAFMEQGSPVAIAMVAQEGALDEQIADQILMGRRRPQGHLLPQTLTAHLGIQSACAARYWRVIRIAVQPTLQGRGYGGELLEQLQHAAKAAAIDLIGASFGASAPLLRFWQRHHYQALFVGSQRNTSSGSHSVTMTRSLSALGEGIQQQAQRQFTAQLPLQLSDPLREMEGDIALLLLLGLTYPRPLLQLLIPFAHGQQPYDSVLHLLYPWALHTLSQHHHPPLSSDESTLLIHRLLQHRTWRECATQLQLPGRRALLQRLRTIVAARIPHPTTTGTINSSAS